MRNRPDESGRTVRDLLAWQKAMDLAVQTYDATRAFPPDERFVLTSQMRRAAISIASNIAEGHGRARTNEFAQSLRIAKGSASELDTQVELARRLGYLSDELAAALAEVIDHTIRLITNLARSLP